MIFFTKESPFEFSQDIPEEQRLMMKEAEV
jgi:hypothetical protein